MHSHDYVNMIFQNIVPSGSGTRKMMKTHTQYNSAQLSPKLYDISFFKLSKINLPSSTPVTIVAKLSSIKIKSAVSLLTSVPEMPIATPMSAFFKAGLSLTPEHRLFIIYSESFK